MKCFIGYNFDPNAWHNKSLRLIPVQEFVYGDHFLESFRISSDQVLVKIKFDLPFTDFDNKKFLKDYDDNITNRKHFADFRDEFISLLGIVKFTVRSHGGNSYDVMVEFKNEEEYIMWKLSK